MGKGNWEQEEWQWAKGTESSGERGLESRGMAMGVWRNGNGERELGVG